MAWHRIYALLLKNFYHVRQSWDRKIELLYWPIVDLVLWGITSLYFRSFVSAEMDIVAAMISGIILWYFLWQAQNELNIGFLLEMWSQNFVNLFVSPLKFYELIFSLMAGGVLKALTAFTVSAIAALVLYKVDILPMGLWIFPLGFLLIMTGWAFAFVTSGFILRYGTNVQSVGWTLVFLLSPFSAVYYPMSILPAWAQSVAQFVPASYIFESMRSLIYTGNFDHNNLAYSFVLNLVYLSIGAIWLRASFRKTLENGLVKVK